MRYQGHLMSGIKRNMFLWRKCKNFYINSRPSYSIIYIYIAFSTIIQIVIFRFHYTCIVYYAPLRIDLVLYDLHCEIGSRITTGMKRNSFFSPRKCKNLHVLSYINSWLSYSIMAFNTTHMYMYEIKYPEHTCINPCHKINLDDYLLYSHKTWEIVCPRVLVDM